MIIHRSLLSQQTSLYPVRQFIFNDTSSTSDTPDISDLLISLLENLVINIKTSLATLCSSSENIILKDITNDLSLLVAGGIKQDTDRVRLAFELLHRELNTDVIDMLLPDSDELFICQQLNFRTIIVSPVTYLLPNSIEHQAAEKSKISLR